MKKHIKYYGILLTALLTIISTSCKKKNGKGTESEIKGNYFSIKQFTLDEWNTFAGEPFLIIKTVRVDKGKTDSSYTNSDTINWGNIFKVFFETDISDRKYLEKYNFTQFDDNQDMTHNFFYQAKDEDLFTQKLLITIDQFTMKVKGLYIETFKKSGGEYTQKLYYAPMQTIQIQMDEKPLVGNRKFTVTQWYFER